MSTDKRGVCPIETSCFLTSKKTHLKSIALLFFTVKVHDQALHATALSGYTA
jgi:hypothetical protein